MKTPLKEINRVFKADSFDTISALHRVLYQNQKDFL